MPSETFSVNAIMDTSTRKTHIKTKSNMPRDTQIYILASTMQQLLITPPEKIRPEMDFKPRKIDEELDGR